MRAGFRSDMLTNHPDNERGRPTHLAFERDVFFMNKIKNRELRLPDQEKAEAVRTGTDDAKFLELNTWINICRHLPTRAKSGQPQVADHLRIFAVEGVMSHKWKKEDSRWRRWRRY